MTELVLRLKANEERRLRADSALLNERRLAKPDTPLTEYWAGRLGLRHSVTA